MLDLAELETYDEWQRRFDFGDKCSVDEAVVFVCPEALRTPERWYFKRGSALAEDVAVAEFLYNKSVAGELWIDGFVLVRLLECGKFEDPVMVLSDAVYEWANKDLDVHSYYS